MAQQQTHFVHRPAEIQWKPAPAALPPGAQVAVLRGDPAQPGLFTMRLKFPAGYIVSPHWHASDEHATVLSGTLLLGVGEKFDAAKLEAITPGMLMVMPATHRHFARFDQETVLQLHGIGPWVVNYVNPADDPRKK
jgi:quercetin dioxygenase-like cupin family protein